MILLVVAYVVGVVLAYLGLDWARRQEQDNWTDREVVATAILWPLALVAFVTGIAMLKATGNEL